MAKAVPSLQEQETIIAQSASKRELFDRYPELLKKALEYNAACEKKQAIEGQMLEVASMQMMQPIAAATRNGPIFASGANPFNIQTPPNPALARAREVAEAVVDATRLELYQACLDYQARDDVRKAESFIFSLKVGVKQPEFNAETTTTAHKLKAHLDSHPAIIVGPQLLEVLSTAGEADNAPMMGVITDTFGDLLFVE